MLVAEDNPVNRKLVTTLLRKRGHVVRAVENGREAVEAIDASGSAPFDLVLMDIQMPEMGGFEAAQAVREREKNSGQAAGLPLIALTAHAMQGDCERCLAAGMDEYLLKPIDVDELIAAVERFGGGRLLPIPASRPRRPPISCSTSALRWIWGGDRKLLAEVIGIFRGDYPRSLRRIDQALKQRDGEAPLRGARSEGRHRNHRRAGRAPGGRGTRAGGARCRLRRRAASQREAPP